jgi:hypothetical protein
VCAAQNSLSIRPSAGLHTVRAARVAPLDRPVLTHTHRHAAQARSTAYARVRRPVELARAPLRPERSPRRRRSRQQQQHRAVRSAVPPGAGPGDRMTTEPLSAARATLHDKQGLGWHAGWRVWAGGRPVCPSIAGVRGSVCARAASPSCRGAR